MRLSIRRRRRATQQKHVCSAPIGKENYKLKYKWKI